MLAVALSVNARHLNKDRMTKCALNAYLSTTTKYHPNTEKWSRQPVVTLKGRNTLDLISGHATHQLKHQTGAAHGSSPNGEKVIHTRSQSTGYFLKALNLYLEGNDAFLLSSTSMLHICDF